MSAERKIAIFDPDVHLYEALKVMFQAFGHIVVAFAHTPEAAREELARLKPGDCDIFLIHGGMKQHATTHEEGEALAQLVNDGGLGVVVGTSLEELEGAQENITPGTVDRLTKVETIPLAPAFKPAA